MRKTIPRGQRGIEDRTAEESDKPVIIDMFSGAGGESSGIEQAAKRAGLDIKLYAINHWQKAVETHQANFPDAEHICRDIADINPADLVPGGEVPFMWTSPECTQHSPARGGKPINDQKRVTPFTILDWLNKLTVDRLIIENVREFEKWGPIDENGRPIKDREGEIFNAYIAMIRGLGYEVEWKTLNAADYGAPTTRSRLFIQAVRNCSGKKILWPEPTHSASETGTLSRWIPAREIIDWTIPVQILDERKKPLAANTMARICRGIEKYWGETARPFLVRYNGGDNRVHSIDKPLPVQDTSNRYGLVQPLVMHIGQTSSKGRTRGIDEPLATVVTKQEACLISPLFIPQHSGGSVRPTTGPLSTVTTDGAIGLVEPLIMNYNRTGVCRPVSNPIPTVTTRDRFALITAEDVRIGFRMLRPHELAAAQSFPANYVFHGTREEVVKQIGNAVCPRVAEALTAGYMRELARSVAA